MHRLVPVAGFSALVGLFVAILSAAALAAGSAWPKPGYYAGPTSENRLGCGANYGEIGCKVTFKVADGGRRVTGFTTADGYNGMCHFLGSQPHIFQYLVKLPPMKVEANGSFTGTAKATVGPFKGTFKVKGRFSSGKAHGTVTRIPSVPGYVPNCGSGASNPTTSDYLETFTAKRT